LGDQRIVRQFQLSGRSGFHCRVLKEGLIEANQSICILESDNDQHTIADILTARNRIAGF
jgi:MOSC domain-containing protein YiiM